MYICVHEVCACKVVSRSPTSNVSEQLISLFVKAAGDTGDTGGCKARGLRSSLGFRSQGLRMGKGFSGESIGPSRGVKVFKLLGAITPVGSGARLLRGSEAQRSRCYKHSGAQGKGGLWGLVAGMRL